MSGLLIEAELQGITKSFGPLHANQDVSLKVIPGTIHALIGENGAGKSTASKILFGMTQPDAGEIFINRTKVKKWNSHLALTHGLGMVHQHFTLADTETVQDNLVLGVEKTEFLFFRNRKKEAEELACLMQKTGLHVPLNKRAGELSVGIQSRCEILKVLYRNASLLILDEPTAVLTPSEIEEFLKTLLHLKQQGKSILIVTHKLKEVMAVADEATVLRAGKTVGFRKTTDTSIEELTELMIGKKLRFPHCKNPSVLDPPVVLELAKEQIKLRAHQITGIAGIEGNGQEELVEAILKHHKCSMGLIPADRRKEGLVLDFSLLENLRLGKNQRKYPVFSKFPKTSSFEKKILQDFDVRPMNLNLPASALSGGNQQKLIVGREISSLSTMSLLVAIHPTRGVDLGAVAFIHQKIIELAEKGAAVLVISSELEELMNLCHKIAVIYQKKIVCWFDGPDYNEKNIGHTMLTGHLP